MEAKQNLNKQNFFDEATAKLPVAIRLFDNWLNEYALATGWNDNFVSLSFEMQLGVIIRFVDEHNESDFHHQYFQDYYTHDLTNTEAVMGWFFSFLSNYDQQHNPDHLITNPPGEEDDLPF